MLDFHWFLPTYGDSRDIVGGGHGQRAGSAGGDHPLALEYLTQVVTAAEQMGFEAALVPTGAWCEDAWVTTATLVQSTRRLKLLAAFRPGLMSPRYRRCDEFLTIVRELSRGESPVTLYFGGSSPAAGTVAARHADVYLTWGEPTSAVAGRLAWIRGLAAERGRTIRAGIRLHVITRDTPEAAWSEAQRLLDGLDPAPIVPNLWAGVGLAGGAGTALVGSHDEVAERIIEYADLGISEFILSGCPHLEEAYWFGEGVLPLLRERGMWRLPEADCLDFAVASATPV